MSAIKVVFILGTLDIAGTERQLLELLRHIDRRRFEVKILAFERAGRLRTELKHLGIPCLSLDLPELRGKFHPQSYVQLYRMFRNMIRFLKQERPHLVQTYLFWANVYGSLAAKLAGVPVIVTGRRALMETRYKVWYRHWLQNCSNLCATAIVANSQVVKAECLQRDWGVTADKIRVIYNGIDLKHFQTPGDGTQLRIEFRIPPKSLVIGMLATFHPRKRHEDLLRALPLIHQRYPQTVLVCVGRDNGARAELEALTDALGIQAAVRFAGERQDIPEILALCDIVAFPSEIEGMSNVLLEALAAGKPVVAARVAGNPEIIQYEQTGLLVPPRQPQSLAEAILRLLDSAVLRQQFGDAGRQWVEKHFRVEQMVSETEELYRTLVAASSQS